MATRQWKRGTAATRTANTTVPTAGELGVETDTGSLVVADGVTTWAALSPAAKVSALTAAVTARTSAVALAEKSANKNIANGYAGLDSGSKILVANLPTVLIGDLSYQGSYDMTTGAPASPSKGQYWIVTMPSGNTITVNWAGTSTTFNVGDWITYDGTFWDKIDNSQNITSVAGRTGVIVLGESDITGLPTDLAAKSPYAAPTFTGVPAAPTAASGTNTTQMATTAFTGTAIAAIAYPITTVATRTGAIVLGESDVTNLSTDLAAKSPLASPSFTGVPAAPTAAVSTNTTQVATTAFSAAAVAAIVFPITTVATRSGAVVISESDVTSLAADLAARSLLASPTFTGVPAGPTAAAGTSTTQAASTAFVTTAVAAYATSYDGGSF